MYRIDPLIYVGQNILSQCLPYITGKQVCIVTQKEIPNHFLNKLKKILCEKELRVVYVDDGENTKSWKTLEYLVGQFVAFKFNRESTVVALGGGVIGDIAGFAASIYLRGVNLIQVPTTLLSQVDASVGGKTAINHSSGKNLIGSFYPAKSVIIDIDCLQTLPQREYAAGLAEVIKIACVRDANFFAWLEKNTAALLAREASLVTEMIYRSVKLKAEIVEQDEKEQGLRMLLNFGHTVAHAIETATDYHWLHGEAVAVGIVQALQASQKQGLDEHAAQRIIRLLQSFGLPTQLPEGIAKDCVQIVALDKKQRDQGLLEILLEDIGKGIIKTTEKQELTCSV